MSTNKIIFFVSIDLSTRISTYEEGYGLYNGVFRFTTSEKNIEGHPAKFGVLGNNFVSTITKMVNVKRHGNYASLSNISVLLSNNKDIFAYLKTNNITLQSHKLEIAYLYNSTDMKYLKTMYTGLITIVDYDMDYIKINTNVLNKSYNAVAAELITGTDKYKPILIGDIVEHATGIPIKNTEEDIPVKVLNSEEIISPKLIMKVKKSTSTYFTGVLLSTQHTQADYPRIARKLRSIIRADHSRLYAQVIDGSGIDSIFQISGLVYSFVTKSIVFTLSNQSHTYRNTAVYNQFPEVIQGEEYRPYNSDSYEDPNFSIVRIYELSDRIEFDGWESTSNGFNIPNPDKNNNISSTIYLYNEDTKKYMEFPKYSGGFQQDNSSLNSVYQISPKDFLQLPFSKFKGNVSNFYTGEQSIEIADKNYEHNFLGELPDKTLPPPPKVLLPEELVAFGDIFDPSNYSEDSKSYWTQHDGKKTGSPSVKLGGNPQNVFTGDLNSSWIITRYRNSVPDKATNRIGYQFKLALPKIDIKPEKLYLVGNIFVTAICARLIMLSSNNGRGNSLIHSYKWVKAMYPKIEPSIDKENSGSEDFYLYDQILLSNSFPPSVTNEQEKHLDLAKAFSYYRLNRYNKDGEESFGANQVSCNTMTHYSTFSVDMSNWVMDNTTTLNLSLAIAIADGTKNYCNDFGMRFNSLQWVGEYKIDPEKTAFRYKGRRFENDKDGTTIMNKAGKFYEHVCRLQNFSNNGVNSPVGGWGTAYPTLPKDLETKEPISWDNFIDSSTTIGGTANSSLITDTTIEGVKLEKDEMSTDKLKIELNQLMWSLGTLSNDGIEKVYPLIDSLYYKGDDCVQIGYNNIVGRVAFSKRQFDDIYVQGVFSYNFEKLSGYSKSISILNVESTYASSNVIGISKENIPTDVIVRSKDNIPTDVIVRSKDNIPKNLWSMGKKLYDTFGVVNEVPENIRNVKLLQDESSMIKYITNFYKWQGVDIEDIEVAGSEITIKDRYELSFDVGLDFYIEKALDIGSIIKVKIPTITTEFEDHRGIITSTSISIKNKATVKIKAEMIGDLVLGSNDYVIDESGERDTVINESGTQENNFTEGS